MQDKYIENQEQIGLWYTDQNVMTNVVVDEL